MFLEEFENKGDAGGRKEGRATSCLLHSMGVRARGMTPCVGVFGAETSKASPALVPGTRGGMALAHLTPLLLLVLSSFMLLSILPHSGSSVDPLP